MKRLSTKEIVLLVFLVFVVSGALYYSYYFRPYQEKMIELNSNIQVNRQRLLTLQNEKKSITKDTKELEDQMSDIEDYFKDIPTGIDEPEMLVFLEKTLSELAGESTIRFSPDVTKNMYFQTSEIIVSYKTTYDNLKKILDGFNNAPFSNRIISLNAIYKEPCSMIGPEIVPGSDPVAEILGEQTTTTDTETSDDENTLYLSVEMKVECFTLPGEINNISYPFMEGPYNNTNLFE